MKVLACHNFYQQPGGEDQVFDLANDGVTYGKLSADGEKYADQLDEVKQQIIDGEITDIPDKVQ